MKKFFASSEFGVAVFLISTGYIVLFCLTALPQCHQKWDFSLISHQLFFFLCFFVFVFCTLFNFLQSVITARYEILVAIINNFVCWFFHQSVCGIASSINTCKLFAIICLSWQFRFFLRLFSYVVICINVLIQSVLNFTFYIRAIKNCRHKSQNNCCFYKFANFRFVFFFHIKISLKA